VTPLLTYLLANEFRESVEMRLQFSQMYAVIKLNFYLLCISRLLNIFETYVVIGARICIMCSIVQVKYICIRMYCKTCWHVYAWLV